MQYSFSLPSITIDKHFGIKDKNTHYISIGFLDDQVIRTLEKSEKKITHNHLQYDIILGKNEEENTTIVVFVKREQSNAEASLSALLQSMDDIVIEIDNELRYSNVWTRDESKLFVPREQLLGKTVTEVIPPPLGQQLSDLCAQSLVTGERLKIQYGTPNPADDREFEASISPILQHGKITSVSVLIKEITELKRSERELAESLKLFNQAFENAPLGIGLVDDQCKFHKANPAHCELLGYTEVELVSKCYKEITEVEDYLFDEKMIEQAKKGEVDVLDREGKYIRKCGEVFYARMNASVIRNDDGSVKYFIMQFIDTNERRKYEEKLVRASEEAQKSAKVKSEFLAQMSHEIRTPMNAIVGITNLLLDEVRYNSDLYEKVKVLKFGSENLISVVNDILDVSKIEEGKLTINSFNFNVIDLIEGLKGIYSSKASQKGLLLEVSIAPDVPKILKGDQQRITQILSNLISNAVKFTSKGKIELDVYGEEIQNQYMLMISVADTGIGIDDRFRNEIFEPFTQAKNKMVQKMGGTGLGLNISKRLSDMMCGELDYYSKVGEGTTFLLKIPLNLPLKQQVKSDEMVNESLINKNIQILLVEDNPLNIFVTEHFFLKQNIRVQISKSGEEALLRTDLDSFNVILMDMQMDGLSGLETVSLLRKKGVECTVFMLTADTSIVPEGEDWNQLRISDIIYKPFVPNELLHKINHALQD